MENFKEGNYYRLVNQILRLEKWRGFDKLNSFQVVDINGKDIIKVSKDFNGFTDFGRRLIRYELKNMVEIKIK